MPTKIIRIATDEISLKKSGKAWRGNIDGVEFLTDIEFFDGFPDGETIDKVDAYLNLHASLVPEFKKTVVEDY